MPTSHRLTFLQAALLVSFLMHAVGLFGWSLSPPLSAASTDPGVKTYVVDLVPYRERAPVAKVAAPPADPPAPPPGPRVGYAEGYVGTMKKPTHFPQESAPKQQPRRRTEPIMHDVPAPPPPTSREDQAPQPSPSPAASSDPPPPTPAPTPVVIATPTPEPSPSPVATPLVAASPSPSPVAAGPTQDPRADFSLVINYHNDDRIKRDANGLLELDLAYISGLPDVKPVLAQNARSVLPLREAGKFGLHPMALVKATVKVSVDLKQAVPQLVAPTHIQIVDVSVDGKTVQGAQRDQLVLFIQDGVGNTKWFPASNKGIWSEHSEQTFEVEVIQVSDDTAMSPPTSRAP